MDFHSGVNKLVLFQQFVNSSIWDVNNCPRFHFPHVWFNLCSKHSWWLLTWSLFRCLPVKRHQSLFKLLSVSRAQTNYLNKVQFFFLYKQFAQSMKHNKTQIKSSISLGESGATKAIEALIFLYLSCSHSKLLQII